MTKEQFMALMKTYNFSEDTLAFAEKCFDAGDIQLLVNSLARIVKC